MALTAETTSTTGVKWTADHIITYGIINLTVVINLFYHTYGFMT